MKKFYFLGTCNTCQRILNHLDLSEDFELKDIKKKSDNLRGVGTA